MLIWLFKVFCVFKPNLGLLSLVVGEKKTIEILVEIALNLDIAIGSIVIFTI